jgi:hypothetical protein
VASPEKCEIAFSGSLLRPAYNFAGRKMCQYKDIRAVHPVLSPVHLCGDFRLMNYEKTNYLTITTPFLLVYIKKMIWVKFVPDRAHRVAGANMHRDQLTGGRFKPRAANVGFVPPINNNG